MSEKKTGGEFWIPSAVGNLLEEIKQVTPERLEKYKTETQQPVEPGERIIAEVPDGLVRILALAWEKQSRALTVAAKIRPGKNQRATEDLANRLIAEVRLLTNLFWDDVTIQCALWQYEAGVCIRKGNYLVITNAPSEAPDPSARAKPKQTIH